MGDWDWFLLSPYFAIQTVSMDGCYQPFKQLGPGLCCVTIY